VFITTIWRVTRSETQFDAQSCITPEHDSLVTTTRHIEPLWADRIPRAQFSCGPDGKEQTWPITYKADKTVAQWKKN
jgi:hypothetical protein